VKIKEYEDNIEKLKEEKDNIEMKITDELLDKEETVWNIR
jgi:dynactin complex subunit